MTKLKEILLIQIAALVVAFGGIALQPVASAQAAVTCTGGGLTIPKCKGSGSYQCANASDPSCLQNNPIVLWINFFINLVSAVVALGAVLMVIYAGLQYASARDNPQMIQSAKQKLTNVVIGIAAFIFLYAFLQWLIPGGVF